MPRFRVHYHELRETEFEIEWDFDRDSLWDALDDGDLDEQIDVFLSDTESVRESFDVEEIE
jgi:hypothetical protein